MTVRVDRYKVVAPNTGTKTGYFATGLIGQMYDLEYIEPLPIGRPFNGPP